MLSPVVPLAKEFRMPYEAVEAQFKTLQGEVLTIIDAAVPGLANKATKDLVNKAVRQRIEFVRGAYKTGGDPCSE